MGLAISGLAIAVAVWQLESRPYHFIEVTPGKVYRSGTLEPHHLRQAIERLGLRTVVSLRTPGENAQGDWYEKEVAVCREMGVALLEIPIDEPPSQEHISRWLDIVADEGRLPLLVHCKHGSVRTNLMVGIYEMEILRKDNAAVLEELPIFGHNWDDPWRIHLRRYLEAYVPRWKRAASPSLNSGRP